MDQIEGHYGSNHIIAGIDPSMTSTGLVIIDSQGNILDQGLIETEPHDWVRDIDRFHYIRDQIIDKIKKFKVTLVVIEHFSYGSPGKQKSSRVFQLAGLGYIIRSSLATENYKYYEVSPNSLKAFVAENGTADKPMISAAILEKYGLWYDPDKENDIADAYGLSRMLLCLGERIIGFSEKGGAQKLKKLRKKLSETGELLI